MSHALPARPVHPEDVALVVVLLGQLERPARLEESTPPWRFSGRWFHHGPFEMRRPRR